jgi:hypothetical protein
VFLQTKLTDHHFTIKELIPQVLLGRVNAEWNPESIASSGLWDTPAELILAFF